MTEQPTTPPGAPGRVSPPPIERVPAPLRAAIERRGFTELTAVQIAALDAIDGSRDLRISSQTGSGKTVALGLAIAPDLVAAAAAERPGPAALIIVPTRELAAQVRSELEWLYAGLAGVRVDSVTGGTHVGGERQRLRRKPAVVVGTPGRLVDHIGSGALDCSGVRQLVLDEADQMLDLGFRDELEAVLAAMPAQRPRTHMLSATFPPAVRELTERFQSDPLHVEGTRLGRANEDIAHVAHRVQPRDRYGAVANLLLLAGDQRTLIFVATRADAANLAQKLADDGFPALPLSGEFAQAQRTRTLNAFRTGAIHVLVATDVAARGLDVPEVGMVIHGSLPMDGEIYTHRSGRTGRAGRKGRSVMLVAAMAGERRARRILADARVDARWLDAPNAADVERALAKRRRRNVNGLFDSDRSIDERDREFARSLLEGRDPAEVVATLIAGMPSGRVRAPFELDTPRPRPAPDASRDRGDASFTRFRISWGARHGANPRRILAAVCRRGGVSSQAIGAIDIDAYSSTFDVAAAAAPEFERRAGRRDERDPQQHIERLTSDPRPHRSARPGRDERPRRMARPRRVPRHHRAG